ncbi:AraC family transcriptional regulator [Pseudonocardia sp. CA-107938]|uniref:AraC family transcriptional regulator n=1 Tax=Pseudonocardia sp. CA-107938 TaxID=3240021 RepID=UPI003D89BEC4
MRQLTDDDLVARSYAVTHPPGAVVLPGAWGWDQLLHASSGVMRVEDGGNVWVVPPDRALWLHDGARPRIVMQGRVAVRTLYLRATDAFTPGPVALEVSPLLHELILHAVRLCPLESAEPAHRRIVDMIGDLLAVAPEAPVGLPRPRDPRAARLADALAADPGADRSLDRLAEAAGASLRTMERIFAAETGVGIAQWRQRLRLVHALEMLGAGVPVTEVAAAVGYATPSAFTAMFRAQLGAPPTRYLRLRD